MNTIDPLSLPLKPVMAPQAGAWWPPAPGWWLLFIGSLLVLGVLFYFYRRFKQHDFKKTVRAALEAHHMAYLKHQHKDKFVQSLSYTLRQVVLKRTPAEVGLTGQDWLCVLDANLPDAPFTEGEGKWLALAPFLPPDRCENLPIESIYALCLRWADTL